MLQQTVSSQCSNSLILMTAACRRVSVSIIQQLTDLLSWQQWNFFSSILSRWWSRSSNECVCFLPWKQPPSVYSLNKYRLGEADLGIQVHTILEQPGVSSSCVLDGPVSAQRSIEVPASLIIDPHKLQPKKYISSSQ